MICFVNCLTSPSVFIVQKTASNDIKRKQNDEIITSIRSEILYIALIARSKLKTFINYVKIEVFSRLKISMLKKAQKLKESLDVVFYDR